MAHFAVVVVFAQMELMAENNRVGVSKGILDIFGFGSSGANSTEHYKRVDNQYKVFPHGTHSSGQQNDIFKRATIQYLPVHRQS
jgi:hypothetical protein